MNKAFKIFLALFFVGWAIEIALCFFLGNTRLSELPLWIFLIFTIGIICMLIFPIQVIVNADKFKKPEI
jgi:hypothetical protein